VVKSPTFIRLNVRIYTVKRVRGKRERTKRDIDNNKRMRENIS